MGDARAACFYARRTLELAVAWLFKNDAALRLPYQDNLSALIHEPTFKATVGEAVFSKARVIQRLGNDAVHSSRPVRQFDALTAVRELFHIGYWLARTYARGAKPAAALAFDAAVLAAQAPAVPQSQAELQRMEGQLRERDEKLAVLLSDKTVWMRNWCGCARKSRRRKGRTRRCRTRMIIRRRGRGTISSTCC